MARECVQQVVRAELCDRGVGDRSQECWAEGRHAVEKATVEVERRQEKVEWRRGGMKEQGFILER